MVGSRVGEGSEAEREERENSGEVEVAAMAALGGGPRTSCWPAARARARAGGVILSGTSWYRGWGMVVRPRSSKAEVSFYASERRIRDHCIRLFPSMNSEEVPNGLKKTCVLCLD